MPNSAGDIRRRGHMWAANLVRTNGKWPAHRVGDHYQHERNRQLHAKRAAERHRDQPGVDRGDAGEYVGDRDQDGAVHRDRHLQRYQHAEPDQLRHLDIVVDRHRDDQREWAGYRRSRGRTHHHHGHERKYFWHRAAGGYAAGGDVPAERYVDWNGHGQRYG